MVKFKTKEQLKFYRKFHYPHGNNFNSVKLNAIFINRHNGLEHEDMKFKLAYDTPIFITEAERSATEEEVKMFNLQVKKKIIDFVDLTSMKEIELIFKHETDEMIKFYREHGTIAIIIGETFKCEKCGDVYPRRNKTNICSICKGEKNERSNKDLHLSKLSE